LDSNVYISALLFGGNPRLVIECAEAGLFELAVSLPIRTEVERVLRSKFRWPPPRVHEAARHLWSLATTVSPSPTVADCSDPDDNRVLECAMEASALAIVTGDAHLLELHPYRGIAILTPKEFLELKPWAVH
jgi:uncharacterized protein